ncbi:MAG: S41 family peptidase, partial [Candidatus Delongbacteria bacterium]|nr:S41 family peptidase [Candidatus Delongbacteria bacterium]
MKRIFVIVTLLLTMISSAQEKSSDYYQELSDNIRLYFDIMLSLNENYVDTANIEELMSEGIRAMLSATDPYTVLLKDSELDHYNELSTGIYGGIGIYLGTSGTDKRLTVISPMDDTPASKVGLKAGDRIIFINDKDTKGLTVKDASDYLRGESGSKVTLKIKRIGEEKILKFTLTRANINIQNIPYSEVMDNGIGYMKLTQFTATIYHDFANEFEKLISNGAKSLIIDLRYNPGGLLESAVKLCNAFLQKNKIVVFTKGRGSSIDNEYFTYMTPLDTQIPIVVLINGSSASASEIFAGSLQDYDRAIILGEGSFGKGLVQQLFDVGNIKKRNLKMTVRKYYTASGRLIQKDDIFGDKKNNSSDTVFFKTLVTGRKVPSGLGILPDVYIENRKLSNYISSLKMNNYFSDFLYEFYKKYPGYKYEDKIDNRILQEFKIYLKELKFEYKSHGETITDSLLVYSKENDCHAEVIDCIQKTLEAFQKSKKDEFANNIEEIKMNLSIEFSVYKNGNKEKYRIMNQNDNQIKKAI